MGSSLFTLYHVLNRQRKSQRGYTARCKAIILLALLLLGVSEVNSINCYVGYGQEGRERTAGIQWQRKCENTNYCFKAQTTDIKKITALLDYAWVGNTTTVLDYIACFIPWCCDSLEIYQFCRILRIADCGLLFFSQWWLYVLFFSLCLFVYNYSKHHVLFAITGSMLLDSNHL